MKNYIIISLKHSSPKELTFWRANDSGYTNLPWLAGIYSEEDVKASPEYYNDGSACIALELTPNNLESIGFKTTYDMPKLLKFVAKNRYVKPKTEMI